MFPFRKYAKHRHKVAILVVGSEGIVVGSAVFILDADRQIPRPHENEVCQEPPCPSRGFMADWGDSPQLAVADSPFNLSVFAENTHPAVGYAPPLCRFLARTIDYSVFTRAATAYYICGIIARAFLRIIAKYRSEKKRYPEGGL